MKRGSVLLLSAETLRLHVPFVIFLLNQLSYENPSHSVKYVAAVFLLPRAAVSLSHSNFTHSFHSVASLAIQQTMFYAHEAEQSYVTDMWGTDEEAFKPDSWRCMSEHLGDSLNTNPSIKLVMQPQWFVKIQAIAFVFYVNFTQINMLVFKWQKNGYYTVY